MITWAVFSPVRLGLGLVMAANILSYYDLKTPQKQRSPNSEAPRYLTFSFFLSVIADISILHVGD